MGGQRDFFTSPVSDSDTREHCVWQKKETFTVCVCVFFCVCVAGGRGGGSHHFHQSSCASFYLHFRSPSSLLFHALQPPSHPHPQILLTQTHRHTYALPHQCTSRSTAVHQRQSAEKQPCWRREAEETPLLLLIYPLSQDPQSPLLFCHFLFSPLPP